MASNNPLQLSTYPSDFNCWQLATIEGNLKNNTCPLTSDMVVFLNLTESGLKPYLDAYCLSPPENDICPFGFCPNPDIAGPLVRVANYITGLCLAILIFYSPKRVEEAFWSQALITYSLLLTCGISLIKGQLTRFHTIVLISIVCSPVNVYFTGYAIRSFWSDHRLNGVLGRKNYLQRGLVFSSVAVWIAILVYAYLPQEHTKFSQDSCRGTTVTEAFFLGAPFIYAWALIDVTKGLGVVALGVLLLLFFLAPPILVAFSWIAAIIWRRHEIWVPGEPFSPRFCKVWREVVTNYPFLQFWSVVMIPTYYWIGTIELGLLSEHDNSFSLSFGQVLALFAAVPPAIEVIQLAPDLCGWFVALPWVLWIRGTRRGPRTQVPDLGHVGYPSNDSIAELKEMTTSPPQAGGIQGLDP